MSDEHPAPIDAARSALDRLLDRCDTVQHLLDERDETAQIRQIVRDTREDGARVRALLDA